MKIPTNYVKTSLLLMAAILILFCCFIMGGCGTKYRAKKCAQWNCCPTVKDSTVTIHTTSVDTVIINDGKAWLDMMLKCDSNNQVYIATVTNLQNENTDLKFSFDSLGHLILSYKRPKDTVFMTADSVFKFRDKVVQLPPVTTNLITKWQAFQIWCGRIILILLLIWLVYYVVRKFILKV